MKKKKNSAKYTFVSVLQYAIVLYFVVFRTPDKSVYKKIFFSFLNQNICCGYSKEPSQ